MEPHFVGTLDFFSATQNHMNARQQPAIAEAVDDGFRKFDQTIDLTDTIARLAKSGGFDAENVEVSIVPITPVPTKEGEAEAIESFNESAVAAGISYNKIEIVSEP